MAVDLKRLKRQTESGRVSSSSASYDAVSTGAIQFPVKPRSRAKLYLFIGAALALAAGLAYLLRPTSQPPRISRYTQITHDGQQKSFSGATTATVLTDGPRLYIQENIDGRFVIAQ